jgi:hypothetical protein
MQHCQLVALKGWRLLTMNSATTLMTSHITEGMQHCQLVALKDWLPSTSPRLYGARFSAWILPC